MDAPMQHEALERITRQLQQDMRAWGAGQQREDHDSADLNVSAVNQKLPFVTLTFAQSIDGSISAMRGVPTLLSGALSMKMTHMLRTMHDAILVGVGTIIADNPSLNARFAEGLLKRKQALEASGARVIGCRTIRDASGLARVDIRHGLELLRAEAGLRSVMVEGGASILTACLRESARSHLVDTVVITIAPTFIGGLRAIDGLAVNQAAAAPTTTANANAPVCFPRLQQPQYHPLEEDLVVMGRL
uniref:Bacterial bifunctional deaminase-reductase C-terminal domain-containing protein n=1 Tax=Globisporangium ultimum (strain ATCC 200006 / CBS 805.95 / DAOM BR144) TaxID=431595 RepID=K3WUI3_GLOUD